MTANDLKDGGESFDVYSRQKSGAFSGTTKTLASSVACKKEDGPLKKEGRDITERGFTKNFAKIGKKRRKNAWMERFR